MGFVREKEKLVRKFEFEPANLACTESTFYKVGFLHRNLKKRGSTVKPLWTFYPREISFITKFCFLLFMRLKKFWHLFWWLFFYFSQMQSWWIFEMCSLTHFGLFSFFNGRGVQIRDSTTIRLQWHRKRNDSHAFLRGFLRS